MPVLPPPGAVRAIAPRVQELVGQLEEIDEVLSKTPDAKELAGLHDQRAEIVTGLIKASDYDGRERNVDTPTGRHGQCGDAKRCLPAGTRSSEGNRTVDSTRQAKRCRRTPHFSRLEPNTSRDKRPDADFAKVQEWYLEALNRIR